MLIGPIFSLGTEAKLHTECTLSNFVQNVKICGCETSSDLEQCLKSSGSFYSVFERREGSLNGGTRKTMEEQERICVFFVKEMSFKSGVKNRGNDANSEDGTCEAVMHRPTER